MDDGFVLWLARRFYLAPKLCQDGVAALNEGNSARARVGEFAEMVSDCLQSIASCLVSPMAEENMSGR